ncbi:hypothetical protein LOD99_5184 [Oopsacas minuta]|uniref:Uncharacterized protein n=1 Tax=Oopsacas minuta TaxID=111878 RepID=A0AAV7JRP5_9METZ|nr:hypothetical protein LOD99_5184 [Oopsacas minuta]
MAQIESDDDCPCCECQCDCSTITEILRQPSFRKNVITYIFLITCTYLLVSFYYSSARIPRIRPYRVQLGNMNPVWFTTRCLQLDDPMILSILNISSHMSTWKSSTHVLCQGMYQDFSSFYSLDGEVDASELITLIQHAETASTSKTLAIVSLENKFTKENTIYFSKMAYPMFQCYSGYQKPLSALSESESTYHYIYGGTMYGRLSFPNNIATLSRSDFSGVLIKANDWFRSGYHKDPTYCFPHILIDLSTTSDQPPVARLVQSSQKYYGFMNLLTTTAIKYEIRRPSKSNYFVDLLKIHNMMGLVVKHGNAFALSYITPSKLHEVWILSESLDQETQELTFAVLRTLLRDLNTTHVSMSIYLPPLADIYPGIQQYLKLPLFIRVYSNEVCIGPFTESIFDTLTSSRVFHDPFRLPTKITKNVVHKLKTFF